MGTPIENVFVSDPVGDDGVATLTNVPFTGAMSEVTSITIKTDVVYNGKAERMAKLVIQLTDITTEDFLNYNGPDLFADGAPFGKQNFSPKVAMAKGTFADRCLCVPPIDKSPPCKDPQVPFDLVNKHGNPCPLTGNGFLVSGTLVGTKVKYPKGSIITGSLVLICD